MSFHEAIQGGRAQYVTLWLLAGVCLVLGATTTAVLGVEQSTLLLFATVFAAVTAEYSDSRQRRGEESGS